MKQKQVTHSEGFRTFLQNTLAERCQKNPQYSLRAFAKSLNVNHSHLSLILRGERRLTPKFIKKTGQSIGIGPQQLSRYLAQSTNGKASSIENSSLQQIQVDQFDLISDWWHDALLELIRLPSFKNDEVWMAKRLNISVHQVRSAIERLHRIGLITVDRNGKVQNIFIDTTTNIDNSISSPALKKYHKVMFDKSILAHEELPRTIRDVSSMTVAVSSKDLLKAKNLIAEFRVRFMEIMQSQPSQFDEVYQLMVSFFPVTKIANFNFKEIESPTKEREL
jgi:uncharacterized protein (TIGR02147 family)